MRRVVLAALVPALVFALAGNATAKVTIAKIYFDSPGADDGSNKSLNHEWVQIHNGGSRSVNIGDWRIKDKSGHVFVFPHIKLKPGQDVRVHTGSGFDSYGDPIHLHWGSSGYIWNNGGDTATLKKSNGTVADKCSYTGAGSYKLC
jgi:Lamin Tail Domain